MTNPDDTAYRSEFDPPADAVSVRDAEEVSSEEGMMEVRLPIASTGEVRNEGDDPLSATALHGMAQQVDSLTTGVFPEHGGSSVVDGTGRYSQFEKLGYWADADLQREAADDGEDLLMATARMPDPETLPAATGDYREALAILKEQAKRGIPISASIGWRDDADSPGGVDLLETSIVGIGADPRTNTEGGTEALARAAVDAGADPEQFLEEVRAIVRDTDTDDSTDTQNMSDDDTAGEESADTTDDEQTTRAPADIDEPDVAEFVAAVYDGVDAADVEAAMTDAGAEFAGLDAETASWFIGDVLDLTADEVLDLLDADDEDAEEQSGDKDDDEEDDETEQSADTDTDTDDGEERDLAEEVDSLREELQSIRNGDVELDRPETGSESDTDTDTDDTEQRDADTDDSAEESADDGDEPTERATGPDWRA